MKPLKKPYFLKDCSEYSEHVGINRHEGKVKGEINF